MGPREDILWGRHRCESLVCPLLLPVLVTQRTLFHQIFIEQPMLSKGTSYLGKQAATFNKNELEPHCSPI